MPLTGKTDTLSAIMFQEGDKGIVLELMTCLCVCFPVGAQAGKIAQESFPAQKKTGKECPGRT